MQASVVKASAAAPFEHLRVQSSLVVIVLAMTIPRPNAEQFAVQLGALYDASRAEILDCQPTADVQAAW